MGIRRIVGIVVIRRSSRWMGRRLLIISLRLCLSSSWVWIRRMRWISFCRSCSISTPR